VKFEMPTEPSEQIHMHEFMLGKVQAALQDTVTKRAILLPKLARALDASMDADGRGSEDVKVLAAEKKALRLQELCLLDQQKRLRERIECLQTGSSTTIPGQVG
jgi:hypothetical protein